MLFQSHPATHDVTVKTDVNSVRQSIKNLVLTMNYERPFHPELGCQMYSMLFSPLDLISSQVVKQSIINVITQYEPRANVLDVIIDDQLKTNSVNIKIIFTVLNNDVEEQVDVFIDRLR